MRVLEEPRTNPGFRLIFLWCWILLGFVAASGLQVLIYGAPHLWPRLADVIHLPGALYFPFILTLFFGPAFAAAACALWTLRRFYRLETDTRPPMLAIVLVVLLGLASSYLGVYVAFNAWGT